MFRLNSNSKLDLYNKLVVKDEKLNLKGLIKNVRDSLLVWRNDDEIDSDIASYIKYAAEGDLRYKAYVKEEIIQYLLKTQKQITRETIDDILRQYHINCYENLLGECDRSNPYEKRLYDYLEKFRIADNDSIEIKLKKLAQIIYQENYGLSVIDELVDDVENVDGIWTNDKDDIRIQFKGFKRKLKRLSFENEEIYQQVIANSTSYDASTDISEDEPVVFCSRRNGSRITATFRPFSENPYLNIRNFNDNITTKEDILRERTHNEKIIKFNEIIFKGLPNFVIIGPMGSGKTTYLRSIVEEYDDNLGILSIEASNELRLKKYYPSKDVRVHIYSKKHPPELCLDVSFREDRDIILQGEVRTAMEAYIGIYVKQRVARGSGDTYHASGFEEFMTTRRNLLMQTGLYKEYLLAEMDIAHSEDLIYQLLYDRETGRRYINKISEIEVTGKTSYRERVIFKYDRIIDDWVIENMISDQLKERLLLEKRFTREDLARLQQLLSH